jgi:cysteine-rich repeat protein
LVGNSVAPTSVIGGDDVLTNGGGTITIANSTVEGEIRNLAYCNPPPDFSCVDGANIVLANATIGSVSLFYGGADPGSFTLRNSILFRRCTTSVISQGYNVVSDNTGNCSVSGTTTGNVIGVDAGLAPLADNGGPTGTHALRPGSPARDAGNPAVPGSGGTACEATDQRGVTRPSGPRCDIGAFESQCGDGVTQPGEQCDDGNATNGDGCDVNCTPSACGNGVVAPGEDCDDGGTSAGDCCGPTCQFEPAGQPCTPDANVCTDESCDGAGICVHTPNTAPCSDNYACTNGDHCVNGACVPGEFCDPCTPCILPAGCTMPTCTTVSANRARLVLVQGSTDTKDRLKFRWQDGAVDKTAFDDPRVLPPRLCLYDQSGSVLLSAAAPEDGCDDGSCWEETAHGFRYRDRLLDPDGLMTMSFRASSSGRVAVQGRGANLGLVLPPAAPLKARVISAAQTTCFDANFQSPTSTSNRFDARFP